MDVRCFIAIALPSDVKESIGKIIDTLKKTGADVKWVPAANIHLTLKFLGSTDDALVPEMKELLRKKLSHYRAFYIKIAGIGCFPSEKRPRVVWIGIQDEGQLQDIQREINAGLAAFGFAPDERAFAPHLTIGRVRSLNKLPQLTGRFTEFRDVDFGASEVAQVHIMKSELKTTGAEYSSLAEIPLGAGRNDVD